MTIQFDKLNNNFTAAHSPYGLVSVPRKPGLYRNGLKRAFDFGFVLAVAVFVAPVVLLLALIISLDGHQPFFLNKRVGKGGKTFRMLKLRTMVPNAEETLEGYLNNDPELRAEWDATQKLQNDPRITPFGRFLRKTSMDELPQLWNVLVGDMSLVGPRPMLPEQREIYPGLAYYGLRPGVTGLWQISDRNASKFAKRAEFDRLYDEDISFGRDVCILAKTLVVMIRGTGY